MRSWNPWVGWLQKSPEQLDHFRRAQLIRATIPQLVCMTVSIQGPELGITSWCPHGYVFREYKSVLWFSIKDTNYLKNWWIIVFGITYPNDIYIKMPLIWVRRILLFFYLDGLCKSECDTKAKVSSDYKFNLNSLKEGFVKQADSVY